MIYLDHAATTPVDPAVLQAMMPHMTATAFGNASSPHARGRAAAAAIDDARQATAELVGVAPRQIVFTSGATEAINTALKGLAAARKPGQDVLIVSAMEHKAVLDVAEHLAVTSGVKVVTIQPDRHGQVSQDAFAELLADHAGQVFCAALMAVNNETGVVNDVPELAARAAQAEVPLLTDTTQAAGWGRVNLGGLPGAVFGTISAHKFHGPQGVGALVLPPRSLRPAVGPLLHGGGHERGMRSGTLNVPGIVGFGVAARIALDDAEPYRTHARALTEQLFDQLALAVQARRTVPSEMTAGHILSVHLPGVDSDALLVNCPEVAFASGSACTSAVPSPSHVLLAMGLSGEQSEETIRLSVARTTTADEVAAAVEHLTVAVQRVAALSDQGAPPAARRRSTHTTSH